MRFTHFKSKFPLNTIQCSVCSAVIPGEITYGKSCTSVASMSTSRTIKLINTNVTISNRTCNVIFMYILRACTALVSTEGSCMCTHSGDFVYACSASRWRTCTYALCYREAQFMSRSAMYCILSSEVSVNMVEQSNVEALLKDAHLRI